jgi:hypothetical protein
MVCASALAVYCILKYLLPKLQCPSQSKVHTFVWTLADPLSLSAYRDRARLGRQQEPIAASFSLAKLVPQQGNGLLFALPGN